MSDWEANLPPRARERLAQIGEATPAEKAYLRETEKLDQVLGQFFKEKIDAEGLWRTLKEFNDQSKELILPEAQRKLISSVTMAISTEELRNRREGILAIETLKESQNTSSLEMLLSSITTIQQKYRSEKQIAYDTLRSQVETNPQLRMAQVKQGQANVPMQLGVEEAIKHNPQWQQFVAQHEIRYAQEFSGILERLKAEVS
jgi:hypothetical protein